MAANGTYENPSTKPCWETCTACGRCDNKGRYAKCESCSGRHDPRGKQDADVDDFCDCRNGVLRWRTQQGKLVISRYTSNPFKGKVIAEGVTQDERDWNAYVNDLREKYNDETIDPIQVYEN